MKKIINIKVYTSTLYPPFIIRIELYRLIFFYLLCIYCNVIICHQKTEKTYVKQKKVK